MIATFAIEIGLAVYVTWRYKLNNITKLAVSILFFLAVFQLAEYNVCEGAFGLDGLSWSRLGFASITMLPPLGFHLATRIAGEKRRGLVVAAYVSAAAFVAFFTLSSFGITAQQCLGNYVIFKLYPQSSQLFGTYYYMWLTIGTVYCLYMARRTKRANIAAALRALAVGYILFIAPTALVVVLEPSTFSAIPSIMCGFAVMLAIVLAGEVLPQYYKRPSLSGFLRSIAASGVHEKLSK